MNTDCQRCDGGGWVQVHENYAIHLAEQTTTPGTEAHAQLVDALSRSVYPCKDCAPTQFYRWAEGHWSQDHDPGSCSECSTLSGRSRTGSTTRRVRPTPEPLPPEPPEPPPPPAPVQPELVAPERERRDLA